MRGKMGTWLVAMRPRYWFVPVLSLLVGAALPSTGFGLSNVVVATVVFGPFFSGGTYLLNQYYDRGVDRKSTRTADLPVAEGELSLNAVKMASVTLFVLGLALTFALNLRFTILYLLGVALSAAYSMPRARLKGRAVVSVLANGFGYGIIALYAGWVLVEEFSLRPLTIGIPLFLAISSSYVYKSVEDVWADAMFGVQTIAVKLGRRGL